MRVLCATHRDLEADVASGAFREDLYYRVRVVEIDVPPLAARGPDEIETLARHFADRYSHRYGRPQPRFEPGALARLRAHGWPGNVRELEHWVESAIVLAPDGVVRADNFPADRRLGGSITAERGDGAPEGDGVRLPLGRPLADITRRYIEATVEACGGNRTEAARVLEIGRNTVTRTLKRDK